MKRRWTIGLVAGSAVVASLAMWAGLFDGRDGVASAIPPGIRPSNFVAHVTNPFFPLVPGSVFVYRGIKDGQTQIDRVRVTQRTKVIEDVTTTAVHDVATHAGDVLEATTDWYAQDKRGNVWYFGEATKAYENGRVDTEGSWLAGRDGATPGIVMQADPRVSKGYRQELYRGHAEDMAWVVARGGHVRVPYGRVRHALFTLEFSPLEPNVIDRKVYGRGIGIVRETSASGPRETAQLVRVIRP
ncbi:MAG: hypothetical protein ABR600_05560 [Actinomycetota bacterium]